MRIYYYFDKRLRKNKRFYRRVAVRTRSRLSSRWNFEAKERDEETRTVKETGSVSARFRDIMQDRAAGNGVTSAVGLVYEGGICLTLICTIKELLIFT